VTLDELLARESIRATIARYTNAGDNADYEDLVPCYAEDGVFEFSAGRWEGREAIGDALRSMARARGHGTAGLVQRHHLGTCHITIESADNARAITYFIVISEIGQDHAGRYIDRLVRRGGEWQFAHRCVDVEWINPDSRVAKAGVKVTARTES
jgi:ketosteroid isomerase-like protein